MSRTESSRFVYVMICIAAIGVGLLTGYFGNALMEDKKAASDINSVAVTNSYTGDVYAGGRRKVLTSGLLPFVTPVSQESDYPVSAAAEIRPNSERISKSEGVVKYIIREYSDQIAVYEVDENGDSMITNLLGVDVSTLPEHDIESLKEGIVVYTEEEMLQLLEDYMS